MGKRNLAVDELFVINEKNANYMHLSLWFSRVRSEAVENYIVSLAIKGHKFEIILTNRREIFVGHVAAMNVTIKGNKFE